MRSAAVTLGAFVAMCAYPTFVQGAVSGIRFQSPVLVADGLQIDLDNDGVNEVTLTRQTAFNPSPSIVSFFMNGFLLGPGTEIWRPDFVTGDADGTIIPLPKVAFGGEPIVDSTAWVSYADFTGHQTSSHCPMNPYC